MNKFSAFFILGGVLITSTYLYAARPTCYSLYITPEQKRNAALLVEKGISTKITAQRKPVNAGNAEDCFRAACAIENAKAARWIDYDNPDKNKQVITKNCPIP